MRKPGKKLLPPRRLLACILLRLLTTRADTAPHNGDLQRNNHQRSLQDQTTTTRNTTQHQNLTFAIVTKDQNLAFFEPVQRGCTEQALKLTNEFNQPNGTFDPRYPQHGATVECLFLGPDGWDQAGLVQDLLERPGNATHPKIDGLAISVYNETIMTPIINRAIHTHRIPVITFDSDAWQSDRRYYVGTNNTFFGMQLARAMETLKPNGGLYGVISANAPNVRKRVQGIEAELTHQSNWHDHWNLMDEVYEDDGDRNLTRVFNIMEDWAQQNPAVIVSTLGFPMRIETDSRTNTSFSRWRNFVERHRHRNITFLCGDAMDHQLEFLKSNAVDGLVGQLPFDMGVKSIQTLWTLTFDPTADLGDANDEDGDDRIDDEDFIGTNVISHVHIPLRLPPVQVDSNLVGDLRYIGFTLFGIIAVTAVGFATWAFVRRNVRVVRVTQPRFLMMIALGVLLLGACMIPLGLDDGGGTRADCYDGSVELGEHCTAICMSVPWLASLGFTITFSALYSKTRRVNRIFHSDSAFGRVKVGERDVLVPFFVLLGLNVIILTLWTVIDPLTYIREATYGRDGWNRVVETYGVCQSDNMAFFLIPLATVNFSVLLLANWQAYEARDIEAEFAETKYIGICMASLLQAMVTGIPVLFIVQNLPRAYYIVFVLLIFVICMVILMVMFVPKIIFAQQYMNMTPKEQKQFMMDIIMKTTKSSNQRLNPDSQYSLQPTPSGQVSSLGMSGASKQSNGNGNHADQDQKTQGGEGGEKTISTDSSSSDDSGLVYFRKTSYPAMRDSLVVHEKDRVSKEIVPPELKSSFHTIGSGRTNVHNDVIVEVDESGLEEVDGGAAGVIEEVKEQLEANQ